VLSWEGRNCRLFEALMMVKSLRSKSPSKFWNAILVSELIAQIVPFPSFMLREEEQKRQEFRLSEHALENSRRSGRRCHSGVTRVHLSFLATRTADLCF